MALQSTTSFLKETWADDPSCLNDEALAELKWLPVDSILAPEPATMPADFVAAMVPDILDEMSRGCWEHNREWKFNQGRTRDTGRTLNENQRKAALVDDARGLMKKAEVTVESLRDIFYFTPIDFVQVLNIVNKYSQAVKRAFRSKDKLAVESIEGRILLGAYLVHSLTWDEPIEKSYWLRVATAHHNVKTDTMYQKITEWTWEKLVGRSVSFAQCCDWMLTPKPEEFNRSFYQLVNASTQQWYRKSYNLPSSSQEAILAPPVSERPQARQGRIPPRPRVESVPDCGPTFVPTSSPVRAAPVAHEPPQPPTPFGHGAGEEANWMELAPGEEVYVIGPGQEDPEALSQLTPASPNLSLTPVPKTWSVSMQKAGIVKRRPRHSLLQDIFRNSQSQSSS